MKFSRIILPALTAATLLLSSCTPALGAGPTGTASVVSYPSCAQADSQVADPSGPHGLFINDANAPQAQAAWSEIQQYVLPDPTLCGADIIVPWSKVDRGPGASPQYDWSFVTQAAQPWIAAGKKVNLLVWGAAEQTSQEYGGQSMTPQYVQNQVTMIGKCDPQLPATPVFWQPGYLNNYEKLMQAMVAQFGGQPWVGYIRFGLGVGAEDYPENGVPNPQSPCTAQWLAQGLNAQQWGQYSQQLVDFEATLHSPKQLMVGINQYGGTSAVANAVSAAAAVYGFGFGTQGLADTAIQEVQNGQPCYANWCGLFQQYAGKVPLEVQTYTHSNPDGSGPTGPLPELLQFALQQKAQIFELYPQEWLIANDPSYTGYAQYHTAYAQALAQTAAVVGGAAGSGSGNGSTGTGTGNGTGTGSGNGGGTSNQGSGQTGAAPTFKDVSTSYWAAASISTLAGRGILKGLPGGLFQPDATLTRAQFATALVRAFDLPASMTAPPFIDVPAGAWYEPDVAAAVAAGVIVPVDYGSSFNPNSPITRQEIAQWLVLALQGKGIQPPAGAPAKAFSDVPAGSPDASAIGQAATWGLVSGYPDGTFHPAGNANRAEAAVLIYRAMTTAGLL